MVENQRGSTGDDRGSAGEEWIVQWGSPFSIPSLLQWILHLLYAQPVGDVSTVLQYTPRCKMHLHAHLDVALGSALGSFSQGAEYEVF
jgi:hypothetical protein